MKVLILFLVLFCCEVSAQTISFPTEDEVLELFEIKEGFGLEKTILSEEEIQQEKKTERGVGLISSVRYDCFVKSKDGAEPPFGSTWIIVSVYVKGTAYGYDTAELNKFVSETDAKTFKELDELTGSPTGIFTASDGRQIFSFFGGLTLSSVASGATISHKTKDLEIVVLLFVGAGSPDYTLKRPFELIEKLSSLITTDG